MSQGSIPCVIQVFTEVLTTFSSFFSALCTIVWIQQFINWFFKVLYKKHWYTDCLIMIPRGSKHEGVFIDFDIQNRLNIKNWVYFGDLLKKLFINYTFWITVIWIHFYVSKDVGNHGYFWKPKWVRDQKRLGKTVL